MASKSQAPASGNGTTTSGEMSGADILVESLIREGVKVLFGYPGGASMEMHQSLTRCNIRVVLCRHEQGEIFAAEGYAKASGKVGVCMATSGPGATNLVTGLADAKMDSVPLVAITGQVSTAVIGRDAFQETPIIEVTRQITKHNYLIDRIEDIPRVVKEAFYIASSGRPGPVLVDIPKNVQQSVCVPVFPETVAIRSYNPNHQHASRVQIQEVAQAIFEAKRPLIYAGGGDCDFRSVGRTSGVCPENTYSRGTDSDGSGCFSANRSPVFANAGDARVSLRQLRHQSRRFVAGIWGAF